MEKLLLIITLLTTCVSNAQLYTLDQGFGVNGQKKLFPLQRVEDAELHEIAFVNNRYIMINSNTVYAVQSNGSMDATFGSNGKVPLSSTNQQYYINCVKVTSDAIYLGGSYNVTNPSQRGMFIAKLLLADGTYDMGFGTNGIARTEFTNNDYWRRGFTGLEITPTGEMYGFGEAPEGAVLCRILPNGTLDTSFAPTGRKLIAANQPSFAIFYHDNGLFLITQGFSNPWRWLNFITMDASGNLTVLPNTAALGMGSVDNVTFFKEGNQLIFGIRGSNTAPPYLQPFGRMASVDMTSGSFLFGVSLKPESRVHLQQSKIWVTEGTTPSSASEDFGLRRFNLDGTLDQTFGSNGFLSYNYQDTNPSAYTNDLAHNVYVHPDGTLLLTGRTFVAGVGGLGVGAVRYQATPLGTGNNISISKVYVYPNPAASELFIEGLENSEVSGYNITDMTGRSLMSGTGNVNRIYIAGLQAGTYLLNLTQGSKSESIKFVKQ